MQPACDAPFETVVTTFAQLHRNTPPESAGSLDGVIRLRQALRDLSLASGVWDAGMEAIHQADIAALRGLATAC